MRFSLPLNASIAYAGVEAVGWRYRDYVGGVCFRFGLPR